MSRADLVAKLDQLNQLIRELKYQEALDRFYSDELITVENENPPTIGLAAYREAGKKYLGDITGYNAELKDSIITDEDISVTMWHYQFQHREWGSWNRVQVSVQRWKDGKIIHERHHYKTDQ